MTRKCELTGKMALTGNNVSHANNKTKRRFLPNLNMVSLASEKLDKSFKLKVSASALRTDDKIYQTQSDDNRCLSTHHLLVNLFYL